MNPIPLQRRQLVTLAAFASLALALPGAYAQAPDKALKMILPIGPGSGVDAAARAMSNGLSKALGQPVVIENLPGAGGITGTAQLVKAPKDGSTIAIVSNNHVVNPNVYKTIPFDSINDITPIMVVGALPFVLVAHPSLPAKNIRELVALAKAKPGTLNYASSGNGTIIHLAGEMLVSEAQVDIKHVPYRATGQMLTDIIGGQVQMGFIAISVAAPHIKSGALRALGVSTPVRSPLLPEVPTIAEQGLPHYALDGWFGVIGPAGLAVSEVNRLNAGFKTALATPEVRDALLAQGYLLQGSSPDVAAQYFRSEVARMGALVKKAGVKLD
ncbi:tripartite tricarboxylate transporter substrate binding protein [Polaromonas sp. UC242_47]|uniref:tripartite tricarboxylate transporter substrate binding protein n=1 Tax=Polaromonas sp. UC242_47 TaxID=3374626 RepID=UPI00379DEC15